MHVGELAESQPQITDPRRLNLPEENYMRPRSISHLVLSIALLLKLADPAFAADGVVSIDQTKALAGGITTGDLPGFPVSINERGSYRLEGNLVVPDENTTAIEVRVDDVSIDLNGFSIIGPGKIALRAETPGGPGNGITSWIIPPTPRNIAVFNGVVRGMGANGVELISGRVENVRAIRNGNKGISVWNQSIVRGNIAIGNRNAGITAVGSSLVAGNVATENFSDGIAVGCPASILSNVASGNGGKDIRTFVFLGGTATCTRGHNYPSP